MKARMNPYRSAPVVMKALEEFEAVIGASGIDPILTELIKTRVSQLNGCAFCIHRHTADARRKGEQEARLYLLDAWRDSPLYSEAERAALAWAEAVTLVAETHVPDQCYEDAKLHFSDEELVKITVLVGAMNVWNRVAISCRSVHSVSAVRPIDAGTGAQAAGKQL